MKIGLLGIGTFIPSLKEGKIADEENTLTLGYKAAQACLEQAQIDPQNIEALFLGTETPLYEVKPTSVMMASHLGLSPNFRAADIEFACKAGTVAVDIVYNMVAAGAIQLGLAVAADTPQAETHDILGKHLGAGAAALLLGTEAHGPILATLEASSNHNEDLHDFWRGQGEDFPTHTGVWSAQCYQRLLIAAIQDLLEKSNLKLEQIDHVVVHMPTAELPLKLFKSLKLKESQWKTGFTFEKTGNAFTATCLIGFAEVLKHAQPGQSILLASYGSGAGAQAMLFLT